MRTLAVVALLGSLMVATGCASAWSPVTGFLYTDVMAPMDAGGHGANTKTGEATCTSILGWVATGDASITAASANAGITKVHHVDFHAWSVLGVYAKFTTKVSGE
jgi:hypothetical protein